MDISIDVFDGVYKPAEDTFLLADAITNERGSILDMGSGTGYVAIKNAKNNPANEVWASDIDERAINNIIHNANKNNVKIKVIKSDLFEKIPKKFDVIAFNPPYLPSDEEVENAHLYNDNGVITKFIREVKNYLKENGRFYLLLSSATPDLNEKLKLISEMYEYKIVKRKRLFFEELVIIKGMIFK